MSEGDREKVLAGTKELPKRGTMLCLRDRISKL